MCGKTELLILSGHFKTRALEADILNMAGDVMAFEVLIPPRVGFFEGYLSARIIFEPKRVYKTFPLAFFLLQNT